MIVNDNYGSKWVKGIVNWIRNKTIEPYPVVRLVLDGMLECGLRKNKSIEIINEFVELGLLAYEDNGNKIFWRYGELKALETKKINVDDNKEKNDYDDNIKRNIEHFKQLYDSYIDSCKLNNEEPKYTFEEFIEKTNEEL